MIGNGRRHKRATSMRPAKKYVSTNTAPMAMAVENDECCPAPATSAPCLRP